jgi:hypothetical protein
MINNVNDTIVINAFVIGGKKFANVPLSEMRLDPEYQRVETNNVNKLYKNWDIRKCEMLHVSYRDGYFYIVNGQHRYKAALLKGLTHLPCEISTGLTQEDEAGIFAEQNDNIKRLNTYDIFKANLVRKEKTDTIIKNICDSYNITVKKSSSSVTGNLKCLTKVRSIINNDGEECLRWIFDVIKGSGWQHTPYAYGSLVISFLHLVYTNSKNLTKTTTKIISLLSKTNFDTLKAEATIEYPNVSTETALKSYIDLQMVLREVEDIKSLKKSS